MQALVLLHISSSLCRGTDNHCKVYAESLNSTLLAVTDNEKILSKGLEDMAKHINKQD